MLTIVRGWNATYGACVMSLCALSSAQPVHVEQSLSGARAAPPRRIHVDARGDLSCDGAVDFGDIDPFILALTDPIGYLRVFPDCDIGHADINYDDRVDFADIDPFVTLLTAAHYDPDTTSTWLIGPRYNMSGAYRGSFLDGEAGYPIWLQQLGINGRGVYQPQSLRVYVSLTRTADGIEIVDQVSISFWARHEAAFIKLDEVAFDAASGLIPWAATNVSMELCADDLTELSMTVDDESREYFLGIGLRRVAVADTFGWPGVRSMHVSDGALANTQMYSWNRPGATQTPSSLSNPDHAYTTPMIFEMEFTTDVRTLYSRPIVAPIANQGFLIPRRMPLAGEAAACSIKVEGTRTDDGESTSIQLADNSAWGGAQQLIGEATITMPDSNGDAVWFGAAGNGLTVPLNRGAGLREAGDVIDLLINCVHDAAGHPRHDLYYLNRTDGQGPESVAINGGVDIDTKSHWVGAHGVAPAGPRDRYATFGDFGFLRLDGNGEIGSIQVGWEPLILLGDSQVASNGALTRLGLTLPSALRHDRIAWLGSIAGNRFTSSVPYVHTAGLLRYRGDAASACGSLAYIAGADLVFVMGVNDISVAISDPGTRAEVDAIVTSLSEGLEALLDHWQEYHANRALLLGLPHWPGGNDNENLAIQLWNAAVADAAAERGIPYFDPYPVTRASAQEIAPGEPGSFYLADGIHLSDAGATAVAQHAAAHWELPSRSTLRR